MSVDREPGPNDDSVSMELNIGCDRNSQLQLGSYLIDGFRALLLRSKAPIEGAPDGSLAVFVHEYWHHLHNVTTLTGMERFRATQLLVSLFSKTIDANSRESVGSLVSIFSDDDIRQFHEQSRFLSALEGEKGPEGRIHRKDLESRVVSVTENRITVDILKQWTVVGTGQFILGALAIEESTAFLVERMVSEAEKAVYAQAAEFPYWVVSRLAEFLLGSLPSEAILVGLATLSLLSNNPGPQLVTLLREFGVYRAHASDLMALRAVIDNMKPLLRDVAAYATPILEGIGEMHEERGMPEKAVKARCGEYRNALERRSRGPIFDVEGFLEPKTAGPIVVHLARLMDDFPPPTFTLVGEEDEDGERASDTMVAFGDPSEDEHGFQQPQYERALEAQVHYMQAHRGPKGFKASAAATATCPFVSTCEHPLVTLDRDSCLRRPWRHITNPDAGRSDCWYTSGIVGLLGKARFSKVDRGG